MSEIDSTYATVCSMLPFDLYEPKPGLIPKEFRIAKKEDEFSLSIIPNNAYYLVNPDILSDSKDVHLIRVPVPAIELALAIVNDYVQSLLAVELPEIVPGLFAVSGNYVDKKLFSTRFAAELKTYKTYHLRWCDALVRMADDTWSKQRSPIAISDLQRNAARELERKREWIDPAIEESLNRCPYCQNVINFGAIKCQSCNEILDRKKYAELVGVK